MKLQGTFRTLESTSEKLKGSLHSLKGNLDNVRENVSETVHNTIVWPGLDTLPSGTAPDVLLPGCMVLEGGSFRGNYTSGVLDVLMENGINLQATVGTSAGALNGTNYVSGQIGRSIRINLTYRHDPRFLGVSPVVHGQSMLGLRFIVEDVCEELPFDYKRFDRAERRFAVTATDCSTGEVVYFEKGVCCEMMKAIRASASLPFLSQMVRVEGIHCLDGGLAVKIPYQWALNEGYEKIIVVRTQKRDYRRPPQVKTSVESARVLYREYPKLIEDIALQTDRYNAAIDELEALEAQGRLLMLCPS